MVPYYLSGEFTDADIELLEQAMSEWEAVANVSFEEVSPRAGVYNIIKVNKNTWSSSIGENNSNCEMIFGTGGNAYSHVLHELGHALGLLHEHQRPDRDSFVKINFFNIIAQYIINFEVKDNPLYTEEEFEYDYSSIMHYPQASFSKDGSSPTIESLDEDQPINRLGIITPTDALKVREIYGPPEEEE